MYYLDYQDTNYQDLIVPVAEIARFGDRRRLEQSDSCVHGYIELVSSNTYTRKGIVGIGRGRV